MKKKIKELCASLFMGILLFMAGVQTFVEPSYTSKFSDYEKPLKEQTSITIEKIIEAQKNLNEQNLNRKTIAMLSYLNIKYLLNEQQKELMKSLHKLNEKEKIKKYNYDNLFKNKKSTVSNEMLVPIQKEKWYKKILYFIKRIIKKIKLYYKIKRNKKKHM